MLPKTVKHREPKEQILTSMGGKRSKVSICFECDHKFEQSDNCFCAFAMRPPSASVFIPKMYLVVCNISWKPQSRKTAPGRALVESSQPG